MKDLISALLKKNKAEALRLINLLQEVSNDIYFQNPYRKANLLMIACQLSEDEVVEALLEKNPIMSNTDLQGRNALHYAQQKDKLSTAMLLLKRFPALRIMGDNQGQSPLHLAAQDNKMDFLSCYLNLSVHDVPFPCQVDIQNKAGQTPLHRAVMQGQAEATQLLLEKGANPQAQDNENKSPLDYATLLYPDLLRFLQPAAVPSLFELSAIELDRLYQESGRNEEVIPLAVRERFFETMQARQARQIENEEKLEKHLSKREAALNKLSGA